MSGYALMHDIALANGYYLSNFYAMKYFVVDIYLINNV